MFETILTCVLFSAKTQLILLPGNNWTSAETFVSNGSADALSKVVNPDGSITGLIFDVHKVRAFRVLSCIPYIYMPPLQYLDSDNS